MEPHSTVRFISLHPWNPTAQLAQLPQLPQLLLPLTSQKTSRDSFSKQHAAALCTAHARQASMLTVPLAIAQHGKSSHSCTCCLSHCPTARACAATIDRQPGGDDVLRGHWHRSQVFAANRADSFPRGAGGAAFGARWRDLAAPTAQKNSSCITFSVIYCKTCLQAAQSLWMRC